MERKTLLLIAAALSALIVNLNAQELPFERLPAEPRIDAFPVPAPAPVYEQKASPPAKREWLVLIFMNAVNDLGILGYADGSINDLEKAGSTDKVAVLTELGMLGTDPASRSLKFQHSSQTLFIQKDSDPKTINSPALYEAGDPDMGSAAHLVRFVKRGIRRFPAKKVAVIIWDHGSGIGGISWDNASGRHMEVDQLGGALSRIKKELGRKIDVFATDACKMQMAEVAYELKDSVSVLVGSEEIIPNAGYPYAAILAKLDANPGISDEALGKLMVDAFAARYSATWKKSTLSALRTSALPGFMDLLNNWVQAAASDPEVFKTAAAPETVNGTYKFEDMPPSYDLYDYLSRAAGLKGDGNSAAGRAAAALKKYIADDLIIGRTALADAPKTHGLAIYIPKLKYGSACYERLAFTAESLWDDFLRLIMEERLKTPSNK
ncbi:MAG: clostripain-related cysteine peptidase [Elusimicrobiales bacterium]|jgi:hypothetical protein